jgi:hypothetical protein
MTSPRSHDIAGAAVGAGRCDLRAHPRDLDQVVRAGDGTNSYLARRIWAAPDRRSLLNWLVQ